VGDLCECFDEVYLQGGSDEPYMLCRLWSNASAAAGHDPCVPAPGSAYNDTITVDQAPAQGTAALLTFWSDAGPSAAGTHVHHYVPVVVATY
jgi:hypothetical protein